MKPTERWAGEKLYEPYYKRLHTPMNVYQESAIKLIKRDGYEKARRDTIKYRDMSSPGTASYAFHNAVLKAIEMHRRKNPIKGPGKFEGETYAARYAYENPDEDLGDSEWFGWYGRFSGKIKGRGPFHIIVREDSQGFVYGEFYNTEKQMMKDWRHVEREWELANEGQP